MHVCAGCVCVSGFIVHDSNSNIYFIYLFSSACRPIPTTNVSTFQICSHLSNFPLVFNHIQDAKSGTPIQKSLKVTNKKKYRKRCNLSNISTTCFGIIICLHQVRHCIGRAQYEYSDRNIGSDGWSFATAIYNWSINCCET